MRSTTGAVLMTVAMAGGAALAQSDTAQIRKQFEAGHYDQVVQAAGQTDAPAAVYTAAEAYQRMNQADRAVELYDQLANAPEDSPWHAIGLSARRLADGNVDGALDAAGQAVAMADSQPEAHYQLGLVRARKEDWAGAAAEFTRASGLDPSYAYAYYRGGMMYYRAKRVDQMANAFETFMKLAPDAPERPEVMQIMRAVRGR